MNTIQKATYVIWDIIKEIFIYLINILKDLVIPIIFSFFLFISHSRGGMLDLVITGFTLAFYLIIKNGKHSKP